MRNSTGLGWAISTKNALQNHLGHSPNELVFGININTSSVLTDELPSLEAATTSNMVKTNLNALHTARENITETESSEKIWRALRYNVRTYVDKEFVTGDTVYYRRQNWTARDGEVLLKYW